MPPISTSNPIRPLPDLLVNQIAAGEVVERPASVVKELVENSLDAGARRIRIDLEQGGIELIRITDDGSGIPPDQLPMALAPHATSKIKAVEDLDRIGTLGFRGEALASIASVSRLKLRSRTAAEEGASEIEAEGDRVSEVRPAAGPVGTSITVRNLFFNTPARRKFLRTPPTEQGRCVDAAKDLAMAHPGVGFMVTCDGRTSFDVPPGQSARERALAVLGMELADQLIEVHADQFDDARGLALWGLAGLPSISRGTNQAQHVFINGRVVRDKTIQHAIKESYRGLIEPGRHPTIVLMLEMDPGAVDVNVHPSKVEVRFRDSSLVHSVVLRSIREALRGADLTPTMGAAAGAGGGGPDPRAILPPMAETSRPGVNAFVDYFRRQDPGQGAISYDAVRQAMREGQEGAGTGGAMGAGAAPPPGFGALPVGRPAARVLQVHNSYLVTQDDQGVVIVDQHALHERVMFEAMMSRIRVAPLESQRLLSPSVVPASPAQVDRLPELAGLLAKIGVEAEPLGPASVGVHAFPTFLFDKGVDPVEFVGELLEKAEAEGFAPGSEQTLHEVLDMMACKAAVKAGDRMSDSELDELVRLREEVERSSNCPHGRPTSIRLTIRELEKLFQRR
ncbi:MAG: DNA mismatch repair endonuclease MutL [Phycisphaeraceae bacterium]|nr:DNA mismatch repair endonuclease MutL [Phycisphaeraceae bacterium]